MLKVVLRTGLYVTLGVVLTVGVAWACTIWSRPQSDGTALARVGSVEPCWYFLHRTGFGATDVVGSVPAYREPLDWSQPSNDVPAWSVIATRSADVVASSAVGLPRGQLEYARGWPFRALYCRRASTAYRGFDWMCLYGFEHAAPWESALVLDPAAPSSVERHNGRALPLRPIWGGFLANAALFGLASWAALASVGSWRARRTPRG